MDHNLDSLNLESAMGVDFESEVSVEVSQVDLGLSSSSHNEGIPMELEHIEEQPMLMDTGREEIIDFMGDQFVLQEYSVQDDQTTGLTTIAESNQNVLTSQAESMVDLQLQPHTSIAPKIVAVKSVASRVTGKIATAAPPRQVAIAPKPPSLQWHAVGATGKQVAIAPKPVTLVKKVSIGNVMQNANNSMLAQIGKQIVMMPTGTQKLKLMNPTASTVTYVRTNTEQASLIPTKEQPKPVMMAKVIMQGQSNVDINQPAVITKLLPSSSTKQNPTRVVAMQQKTVPITIGNKVVMASPTKQGVKLGKKQIIAIKSPTPMLLPGSPPALSPTTPKKVVLSANPAQNVILKTTAPPKTAQMGKDGSIVIDGQQHTQLHQINVPGKGIQYIRLVTNSGAGKAPGSLVGVPSKFLLTDNKVGGKKFVRIAPAMPKTSTAVAQRSSQSLLAPLSPAPAPAPAPDMAELLQQARCIPKEEVVVSEDSQDGVEGEVDSKAALRSLIESTVADDRHDHDHDHHNHDPDDQHDQHDHQDHHDMQLSMAEVEIEYKRPKQASMRMQTTRGADTILGDMESRAEEHSLIVIPPPYDMNDDMIVPDDMQTSDESRRSLLNMDAEMMHSYDSPQTPQTSEPDVPSSELGMRPRKACNCTKSQCLKLYCDCFANGEFCNRCNCNNCHNNLENEELRQKAIRGCLERNPNAFRPKIGKSKSGGPEIIRRHNKGCNCKRSGCLKNYCECYEAKIACSAICKCVGCRNVEESLERFRRQELPARPARVPAAAYRGAADRQAKQPCSFMTGEVIEAVCQCLLAAAGEPERGAAREPLRDVIDEFARCLQDIIGAARHAAPPVLGQGTT